MQNSACGMKLRHAKNTKDMCMHISSQHGHNQVAPLCSIWLKSGLTWKISIMHLQSKQAQLLKCPWNLPVQAEWDIILNRKKSLHLKMTTLVDRLNLVGCTHPCEQTLKWVLAVALMAHYFEMPSPKIIAL